MNKKDRDETVKMIAEAIHEVVVPALEDMESRLKNELASKEDVGRIERKLDAMQDRLDRHGRDIEELQAATSL